MTNVRATFVDGKIDEPKTKIAFIQIGILFTLHWFAKIKWLNSSQPLRLYFLFAILSSHWEKYHSQTKLNDAAIKKWINTKKKKRKKKRKWKKKPTKKRQIWWIVAPVTCLRFYLSLSSISSHSDKSFHIAFSLLVHILFSFCCLTNAWSLSRSDWFHFSRRVFLFFTLLRFFFFCHLLVLLRFIIAVIVVLWRDVQQFTMMFMNSLLFFCLSLSLSLLISLRLFFFWVPLYGHWSSAINCSSSCWEERVRGQDIPPYWIISTNKFISNSTLTDCCHILDRDRFYFRIVYCI